MLHPRSKLTKRYQTTFIYEKNARNLTKRAFYNLKYHASKKTNIGIAVRPLAFVVKPLVLLRQTCEVPLLRAK